MNLLETFKDIAKQGYLIKVGPHWLVTPQAYEELGIKDVAKAADLIQALKTKAQPTTDIESFSNAELFAQFVSLLTHVPETSAGSTGSYRIKSVTEEYGKALRKALQSSQLDIVQMANSVNLWYKHVASQAAGFHTTIGRMFLNYSYVDAVTWYNKNKDELQKQGAGHTPGITSRSHGGVGTTFPLNKK